MEGRVGERGSVLIEFAVSISVLWLIVAAALDLGRAFASAHVLQSAARTAAREIALQEFAYDDPFQQALGTIFDPDYLVIDADCLESEAADEGITPEEKLADVLDGFGLNQNLRPLMLFERVSLVGGDWHLLRYPGALLDSGPADPEKLCSTGFTVGIPEVNEAESHIVMRPVVEEIEPGAFSITGDASGSIPKGTVGLRLRYPFQAATLSGWRLVDGHNRAVPAAEAGDYTVDSTGVVDADGVAASTLDALDARGTEGELMAYVVNGRGDPVPVYGGSLGLGFQGVLGRDVRPYRRVLGAQAIFARETIRVEVPEAEL